MVGTYGPVQRTFKRTQAVEIVEHFLLAFFCQQKVFHFKVTFPKKHYMHSAQNFDVTLQNRKGVPNC